MISAAISASVNWTAWKPTIARPNWRRSRAWRSASSNAPWARPTPIAAMAMRPPSSAASAWRSPAPRGPSSASGPTSTPSSVTGRVSLARQPIFRSGASGR